MQVNEVMYQYLISFLFQLLNRFDQSETAYTTNAGNMEENKWKNRYKNILPCMSIKMLIINADNKFFLSLTVYSGTSWTG